jgi:hypothetical protein
LRRRRGARRGGHRGAGRGARAQRAGGGPERAREDRVAQVSITRATKARLWIVSSRMPGQLAGVDEVAQVAARQAELARGARAVLHDRPAVVLEAARGEVHPPAPARARDERDAVAAQPGRHRAVEGVDPELDAAHEVVDLADPEQVARAVLGQDGGGPVDHLVHLRLVAPERAADRDARRAGRRDVLGDSTRRSRWTPPWTIA